MPFDAYFLRSVTAELQAAVGAKIDKVQQPTRDTVLLTLRSPGCSRKLLFCLNPGRPRVHFTALNFENPAQPPMFCMLLRKYLTGAKIMAITQLPMERQLDFTLDCPDELENRSERHLVAELMGRTANLILTDPENRIIDCLRRVDMEMSPDRQLLPGMFYRVPQQQEKQDPYTMSQENFTGLLSNQANPVRLDKLLLNNLLGVSPLLCREMALQASGEADADASRLDNPEKCAEIIYNFFRQPTVPVLLAERGSPKEFSCVEIHQYGDFYQAEVYPDCGSLLDAFYGKKERSERRRQRVQQLTKTVTHHRDRTARKLALQRTELDQSQNREQLRRSGDIIMANLYKIQKGDTALTAEDFYDPEQKMTTVSLQPFLSPQQNAGRYYKEYSKAKNAEKILTGQIAFGERELQYLNSVLDELERAETDRDVTEIRAELVSQGYVRETDRKKQMKQPLSRPMEFVSSSGWPIWVGRNNRQNDQLTLKAADKRDIWLHTQKIHGSHVIIQCGNTHPDDITMTEAAQLAAWFSQARDGQNVPVDTTAVKNVKKPVGALPGMVIYDHYNTLYVTPDETLPQRLTRKE